METPPFPKCGNYDTLPRKAVCSPGTFLPSSWCVFFFFFFLLFFVFHQSPEAPELPFSTFVITSKLSRLTCGKLASRIPPNLVDTGCLFLSYVCSPPSLGLVVFFTRRKGGSLQTCQLVMRLCPPTLGPPVTPIERISASGLLNSEHHFPCGLYTIFFLSSHPLVSHSLFFLPPPLSPHFP